MSFVASLFLWSLASLSIPIVIALWNRRRRLVEKFGAFYLLRKSLETQSRRLRLLELLKLINRLVLLTLLILILADPFKMEKVIGEAAEGFAIMVDAGRVMNSEAADGEVLAEKARSRLVEILERLPQQSRGMILWVTDRCDLEEYRSAEMTARPSEWISALADRPSIVFNRVTSSEGIFQCLQKIDRVYSGKNPYKALVSPMPQGLDLKTLENSNLALENIGPGKILTAEVVSLEQELNGDILSVILKSGQPRPAHVLLPDGMEELGVLEGSIDLSARENSWLWVEGPRSGDSWINQTVIPLRRKLNREVTIWAQKESPGFSSLVAALRNHPDLRAVRQIGGSPQGSAVILYGPLQQLPVGLKKAWMFLDPNGLTPYEVRDKKVLSTSFMSADILRSFQILTSLGRITVKRYVILDPNRFETVLSFEDGAPSLVKDRESLEGYFVTPFDLEDLTTDLTLEPTFIPFLYESLEKWLQESESAATDFGQNELIWALPSPLQPSDKAIQSKDWPGIYRTSSDTFELKSPVSYPAGFLNPESKMSSQATKDEEVSYRPQLYRGLVMSLFLELLLCLIGAPLLMRRLGLGLIAIILGAVEAHAQIRPINLGYFRGVDSERKVALSQLVRDASLMSNMDWGEPTEVKIETVWNYSTVVFSSSGRWGPFTDSERSKLREYMERGGLLIFDDPLALTDTIFYRSVKEELSKIFPGRELESVPKDDVLLRTYFLLTEVSGRKLASPNLEGLKFDRRWVAVFSSNDLLGANLRNDRGDYALSVSPYGISQRILAQRLMLNLLMYGVTLDYKDDAIHLPHILKRRVR